jgi:hypothetical protein
MLREGAADVRRSASVRMNLTGLAAAKTKAMLSEATGSKTGVREGPPGVSYHGKMATPAIQKTEMAISTKIPSNVASQLSAALSGAQKGPKHLLEA